MMKPFPLFVWTILLFLVSGRHALSDWVIFQDGQAAHVLAFELTDKAVNMVTLNGKRWSLAKSTVDLAKTRHFNHLGPEGRYSPGWIVFIAESPAPPAAAMTETPPLASVEEPRVVQEETPVVPVVEERNTFPPEVSLSEPIPPAGRPDPRLVLFVNGVVGTELRQFNDVNRFDLFSESGQFESRYSDARAQGPEFGGLFRVIGPVGVGASVELFQNDRDSLYTASLPHPFFFDRFREISGAQSDLAHEETAVHVDATVSKTLGPLTVDVVGGPTWFFTRTDVLVDLLYDEVFPFDSVIPQGVQSRSYENRLLGFNVGASATYRLAGFFGVDLAVRYSRAQMRFLLDEGRELELRAGGLRLGAGLRFLFP
jgi:hypothetical protein